MNLNLSRSGLRALMGLLALGFLCSLAALTSWNILSASGQAVTELQQATSNARVADKAKPAKPQLIEAYAKLPLSFEANQGQIDGQVKFLSRGLGYNLFLTASEAVLALGKPGASVTDTKRNQSAASAVVRLQLLGANRAARITGLDELPGKVNYFLGNDSKRWRRNVPTYAKVKYQNVYPGVDLVYYGNQRQLEYDLIVAPGVSPDAIRLNFAGAQQVYLDASGDLLLRVEGGELLQRRPFVYQKIGGVIHQIESRYELKENGAFGFELGQYDTSQPLLIDPVLFYSTYLGGNFSDTGLGIAVDGSGAYVTGATFSANFPGAGTAQTTSGVYKTTNGGSSWNAGNSGLTNTDLRAVALDPANPATVYAGTNGGGLFKSTNGGGNWSAVNFGLSSLNISALALEPGNATTVYAATSLGIAKSTNAGSSWSMLVGSPNSAATIVIDPSNSATLYASQIPPTGNGVLKSTNGGASWSPSNNGLGGNGIQALAIDPSNPQTLYAGGFPGGGVFKTTDGGLNWSAINTGFLGLFVNSIAIDPLTTTTLYAAAGNGVYKSVNGGANWVFRGSGVGSSVRALAIDPQTTSTVYVSTGFDGIFKSTNGGTSWNQINNGLAYSQANSLAIDPNAPATLYAGLQRTSDTFVAKLNAAGTALLYSTYLGGSNNESGSGGGLAVDGAGNAYVVGDTSSPDFPTTAGAFQTVKGFAQDAYLTKLNASGALSYSTFLGSGGTDLGSGIAVDAAGDAYVTGSSASFDFPTTPNAYAQTRNGSSSDAFVTKLHPAGNGTADLLYSTYLGGTSNDSGRSIKVDAAGNVYVAGTTASTNLATTPGAFQTTYGGGTNDIFVAKLNPNASGAASLLYATYLGGSGDDSGGSAGLIISLGIDIDVSGNAYVTGATRSTNFPVTPSAFQSTFGGGTGADAFVSKLSLTGAGAADLLYSTYLGGSGADQGTGIAVDNAGNAYIIGSTSSTNFPQANAFQSGYGGNTDAFVAKVQPAAAGAASLVFSSYLGGNGPDQGFGIALDNSNNAYVVGLTASTNFPTVNPLQGDQPGQDAFVAKIASGTNTLAGSNVTVQPIDPTSGAAPVTITFSNVIQSGITSLEIINSGPAPPLGFKLGNPAVYYELSTTAVFSGAVQVCINYTGINYSNELNLKLFHREGGVWVNRTVSLNTASNVICASVTSFSPFAIFEEDNLPPTVNAGGPYSVNEGGSVVVNASGADPEGGSLSFAWDLDDNGSFETFGQSVTFSAVGLDGPGNRTIRAQVTDSGGLSATAVATVNLLNVMPTVGAINAPTNPVQANTLINASANFTDPGLLDTHTASWNWGDGNTSSGVVAEANGSGSASDEHTYSAAGVYTITLTLTDKDGAVAQAVFQYVVVYDPGAGFVTGGGWINSPSGAYAPNAALTGKANFGFVSKYQHGANAPSGNTQFNFHVANLNFQSTSYQWLVIAGAKAQYKGEGVINGGGSYGFMLTAVDGQLSGGGGVDKFRIKIWDKATGDIVYDNQTGAADDATPTLALGGGSIVIHKQ